MARWKLLEPHYIFAERDGAKAEWEYKETSRTTGREIRKKFIVPMYMDPRVDTDWTHRDHPAEDGYIVVSDGVNAQPRDIIIDPKHITPGMEALDDEAKVLSAKLAQRIPPIDGPENSTYSERLLDKFIQQISDTQSKVTTNPVAGMDKLFESIGAMMEQNQKILSALVEQSGRRRVG